MDSKRGQDAPAAADNTADLLERARAGDREALEALFARHIPRLRQWASGRLPRWARDVADTSDLVQDTVFATFKHLETFEARGDGALQAYLRQAIVNRIRNAFRRAASQPATQDLDSRLPDEGTSPLEAAIGSQTLEQYEAGLQRLEPEDRDAVMARVELGLSYAEVADVLGKPSPDAARMAVVRALVKLAEAMNRKP
jgi:RNA polymerase sigma-70 factor (ECF subfamily)